MKILSDADFDYRILSERNALKQLDTHNWKYVSSNDLDAVLKTLDRNINLIYRRDDGSHAALVESIELTQNHGCSDPLVKQLLSAHRKELISIGVDYFKGFEKPKSHKLLAGALTSLVVGAALFSPLTRQSDEKPAPRTPLEQVESARENQQEKQVTR